MSIEGAGKTVKKSYQQLGDDTKMTVSRMAPDGQAQQLLARLGKDMCPAGVSYLGSAALHIYGVTAENPLSPPSAAFISQLNLGLTGEATVILGMQELGKRLYGHFNKERTSIDPNYVVEPDV